MDKAQAKVLMDIVKRLKEIQEGMQELGEAMNLLIEIQTKNLDKEK